MQKTLFYTSRPFRTSLTFVTATRNLHSNHCSGPLQPQDQLTADACSDSHLSVHTGRCKVVLQQQQPFPGTRHAQD
jgi:hypothetical protein